MSNKRVVLPPPGEVIDTLEDLINSQRWHDAIELGDLALQQRGAYRPLERDAHFCFRMSLANRLVGNNLMANIWHGFAKEANGYDEQMEDDFRCDVVLSMIRLGDAANPLVAEYIDLSISLNQRLKDHNRLGKAQMIRGRAAYAVGDYQRAEECFLVANDIWRGADGFLINEQWLRNNRFHWMRASARVTPLTWAKQLARLILDDDGELAPRRKQLARLVLISPGTAVRIYDAAEKRATRHK